MAHFATVPWSLSVVDGSYPVEAPCLGNGYNSCNHFLGRGGWGQSPRKKTPPARRRRAGKKFLKGLSLVPEVSRRVVPELVEGWSLSLSKGSIPLPLGNGYQ
jgi:hypothetical protein